MPPTSNVIQGRLNLKKEMFCMDINQGCAGFVIGLMQAFLMLEQESIQKVILINADVLSRKTSPKDRNSFPLVGDAASITVVERDPIDSVIHAISRWTARAERLLTIPAGGFRLPAHRQPQSWKMSATIISGPRIICAWTVSAVFNFVQVEVPPMIEDLLKYARRSVGEVDYFFCHQPNRFMLQKLADKMQLPYAKMPSNVVERFGNSSGVTIPMTITLNLRDRLVHEQFRVCLAGFGVGLTWSSMLLNLGKVKFNTLIEYK